MRHDYIHTKDLHVKIYNLLTNENVIGTISGKFKFDHTICTEFPLTFTNSIQITSEESQKVCEIDLISKSIITKQCKV